jgi:hypothetical protein
MHYLKRFLDFYIQSSLHVGIAVMSLVYVTLFSCGIEIDSSYSFSVFFGTVLGYNFLKYFDVFQRGNFNNKKYFGILLISIIAFAGFLLFFLCLKRSTQTHLIISGTAVLVYPFLRKYSWFKMFWVSLVVTYVTVYIPFLFQHSSQIDSLISLIQRFLIIFSLLVPFEIMDSTTDAPNMKTLPRLIGIGGSKLLGTFVLIPFVLIEMIKQNSSFTVIPIAIVTALFIRFTFLSRTKYYTTFWLESLPIFWMLLLVLFE